MHREMPVSANAIQRSLDALHRDIDTLGRLIKQRDIEIQQRDAEIDHYRRLLAAERAARHDAETRARRAEREAAQHRPTVALTLPPATRPDLYAADRLEGAA